MGKFFSFVHMGKSYISKVPIGPEVSKTNLGTGPGPCKKCGLGPGPGGPLIAAQDTDTWVEGGGGLSGAAVEWHLGQAGGGGLDR